MSRDLAVRSATRDGLHTFLAGDFIPYLHDEEAALYAGSGRPSRRGARARRRAGRRRRDHHRIIAAADAVQFAESAPPALDRAERLRALFDAHLLREDRELIAAANSPSVDGRRPEWSAVLATDLQALLDAGRAGHGSAGSGVAGHSSSRAPSTAACSENRWSGWETL